MQLSLLPPSYAGHDLDECIAWLCQRRFDISKRFYETDESYHRRLLVSAYAFNLSYEEPAWTSLQDWAEICPRGPANRLPRNKSELPAHECYYLQIRDVCPEDWLVPTDLSLRPARGLPKRAEYKPVEGDVLLSRFKEPLGKCVIYTGRPRPLYANSNYFLLRPRSGVSPLLLLALLKSSFLACQVHHLIRRRTLIAEMFQYEVPQIMLPDLPSQLQERITGQAEIRLEAEERYRIASRVNGDYWINAGERLLAIEIMNRVDAVVDNVIMEFHEAVTR